MIKNMLGALLMLAVLLYASTGNAGGSPIAEIRQAMGEYGVAHAEMIGAFAAAKKRAVDKGAVIRDQVAWLDDASKEFFDTGTGEVQIAQYVQAMRDRTAELEATP